MKRRHKGQGSIYKTGESWTVAISMGYDRQTGKRVRLKLTVPTKREAQSILKEKLREIRPAGKDTTVSEWLHHWYANCRSDKIRHKEPSRRKKPAPSTVHHGNAGRTQGKAKEATRGKFTADIYHQ